MISRKKWFFIVVALVMLLCILGALKYLVPEKSKEVTVKVSEAAEMKEESAEKPTITEGSHTDKKQEEKIQSETILSGSIPAEKKEDSKIVENQIEELQREEVQREDVQTEKLQREEKQIEEFQSGVNQSEELQREDVQTEELQREDVPAEEIQSEKGDTGQGGAENTGAHVCSYKIEETLPTCLEMGLLQEICEECQAVRSCQTIEALGHDFKMSIWESPTCLNGGYYNNTCQRCGLVECVTEAALPHEAEEIIVQEGNCMEDTIIRHVCKYCGQQTKSDTRYTPQIHEWITGVVDEAEVTYCSRCGVLRG